VEDSVSTGPVGVAEIHAPGTVAPGLLVEERSTQPDIRLDHVVKRFDEVVAVDDLSLDVEPGEFFSLLGPSGCGKTTTLRMIGGFEQPSDGSIFLGGADVTYVPPYRRDVNTVFQSYALFPHLTVRDNLAFGLKQRKIDRKTTEQRVEAALALVDMAGMEKRKPAQLSGGQQQRVALARAIINKPKVLLLDEPLGALDARLRKHMQLELKAIQRDIGITFIYVTHDQEEALTMSDRLAVMHQGKIEQIGAPQQVYDHPATEFVAGFLGASNLLRGVISGSRGELSTVTLSSGETVAISQQDLRTVEGAVQVGVRPEKIALRTLDADIPDGWNSVTGTVQLATFVGVSYQYTIQGPAGTILTVYSQNGGVDWQPAAETRVRLLWRPDHTFAVE
jgi:spermidine/putrescine transport system ATP-binding protein